LGGKVDELPYNLNEAERIEPNGRRIFNVYVNDKLWLQNFNVALEFGNATAAQKRLNVAVGDENGIVIRFEAIEGAPVLNALQLIKINAINTINETH
jgi:beta-galactosidase